MGGSVGGGAVAAVVGAGVTTGGATVVTGRGAVVAGPLTGGAGVGPGRGPVDVADPVTPGPAVGTSGTESADVLSGTVTAGASVAGTVVVSALSVTAGTTWGVGVRGTDPVVVVPLRPADAPAAPELSPALRKVWVMTMTAWNTTAVATAVPASHNKTSRTLLRTLQP